MALFFAGLAYLAGNLYLSVWLLRWLTAWGWPLTAPAAGAAALVVFWLWAVSPVWAFLARKGPLRRGLHRACGIWLAFMLYGFLLVGAFTLCREAVVRCAWYTALPDSLRARVLAAAGSLALAAALLLCLWGRWRAEKLRSWAEKEMQRLREYLNPAGNPESVQQPQQPAGEAGTGAETQEQPAALPMVPQQSGTRPGLCQ